MQLARMAVLTNPQHYQIKHVLMWALVCVRIHLSDSIAFRAIGPSGLLSLLCSPPALLCPALRMHREACTPLIPHLTSLGLWREFTDSNLSPYRPEVQQAPARMRELPYWQSELSGGCFYCPHPSPRSVASLSPCLSRHRHPGHAAGKFKPSARDQSWAGLTGEAGVWQDYAAGWWERSESAPAEESIRQTGAAAIRAGRVCPNPRVGRVACHNPAHTCPAQL